MVLLAAELELLVALMAVPMLAAVLLLTMLRSSSGGDVHWYRLRRVGGYRSRHKRGVRSGHCWCIHLGNRLGRTSCGTIIEVRTSYCRLLTLLASLSAVMCCVITALPLHVARRQLRLSNSWFKHTLLQHSSLRVEDSCEISKHLLLVIARALPLLCSMQEMGLYQDCISTDHLHPVTLARFSYRVCNNSTKFLERALQHSTAIGIKSMWLASIRLFISLYFVSFLVLALRIEDDGS